jgi:hypothetical protein
LDRADSLFLGRDGSPIIIVGVSPPKGTEDALTITLRETTDGLRAQFEEKYPGLKFWDSRWVSPSFWTQP